MQTLKNYKNYKDYNYKHLTCICQPDLIYSLKDIRLIPSYYHFFTILTDEGHFEDSN